MAPKQKVKVISADQLAAQISFMPPAEPESPAGEKSTIKDGDNKITGHLPPAKVKEQASVQVKEKPSSIAVELPPRPKTVITPPDKRLLVKGKSYVVMPELIVPLNCTECGYDITKAMSLPVPDIQYKLHGYSAKTTCLHCFTENTFDMVILYPASMNPDLIGRGIHAQQTWMKEVSTSESTENPTASGKVVTD